VVIRIKFTVYPLINGSKKTVAVWVDYRHETSEFIFNKMASNIFGTMYVLYLDMNCKR